MCVVYAIDMSIIESMSGLVAILIIAVDVCCYVEYAYYVLLRLTKSRLMVLLIVQVLCVHVSMDVVGQWTLTGVTVV